MLHQYSRLLVENSAERALRKFFTFMHRLLRGTANRLLNEKYIKPRQFSNEILRYYAPIFKGRVINVSGWKDEDREGHRYQSYFTNAESYLVSNAPTSKKGSGSMEDEILVDLTKPIDETLKHQFDVVLNHTTLEHIYEIDIAFKNLCEMSRDAVILVVPTLQHLHFNEGYGDYCRLTPMGVVKHFEKNGFTTLVLESNEQPFSPIYCFSIAVRDPEKYRELIDTSLNFSMGGELFGSKSKTRFIEKHISFSQNFD